MPNCSSSQRFLLIVIVLSFTSVQARSNDGEPHRINVSISGLQYTPVQVTIHAGDTVAWSNDDDRDHTVVARDGTFHSNNLKAGRTFEFKFIKPGSYPYGCDYHPRMKGVVVVEP